MSIIHEAATTDDLRRLCVHINVLHMNAKTVEERNSLFRCYYWVQDKAREVDVDRFLSTGNTDTHTNKGEI